MTAAFIDFLIEKNFLQLKDLHVIGNSLGYFHVCLPKSRATKNIDYTYRAHVAGHAGKVLKAGKIPAIFGMDPAGPLFDQNDPSNRLSVHDG